MCLTENIPPVPWTYAKYSCTHQPLASSIKEFTDKCASFDYYSRDSCAALSYCIARGDEDMHCPIPQPAMDPNQCGKPLAGTYPYISSEALPPVWMEKLEYNDCTW